MKKIISLFNNRYLFIVLILLNIVVSTLTFRHFLTSLGGDFPTYWGLSEGLHHGKYSFWWFYPQYLPDTFRNPGYSVFLYLLTSICNKVMFVQIVQLLLYFVTILIALRVLNKFDKGFAIKNIFLLVLLPNLQIVVSTPNILPDSLTAFFVMLIVYTDERMSSDKWMKYILIGLFCGIIFQLRPVFLLFPFFKIVVDFFFLRKTFSFPRYATLAIIFLLTTVPYGIWNYNNNGTFKITSIEGGGGVFQNAYWSFKLPGYTEMHYWYGNHVAEEMIPFVKQTDVKNNIKAYDREWHYIDSACAKYETRADTLMQAQELRDGGLLVHNAKYTMEREKLLKAISFNHFMHEPLYTIETKIYTAFRIWITGIQYSTLKGKSLMGKIVQIYPFIVSALAFFSFLIFFPVSLWLRKLNFKDCLNLFLPAFYAGIIYLPFCIESRYTIPVRLLLYMLVAISFVRTFETKKEVN